MSTVITKLREHFSATGRDLYVDQLITNMILGYRPQAMIADLLFPVVPVLKQSSSYTIFEKNDILRLTDDLRSPNKEANIIEQSVSKDQYFCENRALKTALIIEDRVNADPVFMQRLLNGQAQFVTDKLFLNWEKRIADQVMNVANVGGNAAPSAAWTIPGTDVIGDLWSALDNREDAVGYKMNSVVMGEEAWRSFRRNPAMRDLLNGNNNGGGYTTMDQAKTLFGLERFNVGAGFYNAANEGQAVDLQRLWNDSVLVYYAPVGAPSMVDPSFGYSFRWNAPGLANMTAERHPYDNKKKSEEIEVGYYQDEKIVGKEYSFLITDVNI